MTLHNPSPGVLCHWNWCNSNRYSSLSEAKFVLQLSARGKIQSVSLRASEIGSFTDDGAACLNPNPIVKWLSNMPAEHKNM